MFGGVAEENVILMPNADTIYRVPLVIAKSGLNKLLSDFSGLRKEPDLSAWQKLIKQQSKKPKNVVNVGLVAKYVDNEDTYISVIEALKAASWNQKTGLKIHWINAEELNINDLKKIDAILVPGGFGPRGIEGKIKAARFALDNDIPYLGICLGLQVAIIAGARKAGLRKANSTEFEPRCECDVVYIMDGQQGKESTGGTLRLGDYPAKLIKNSKISNLYRTCDIVERHRHRYEVNQKFLSKINKSGLVISGLSPDGKLVEFIEAPEHTYIVATQAHPEFRSRPTKPHPLFVGLIKAGYQKKIKVS